MKPVLFTTAHFHLAIPTVAIAIGEGLTTLVFGAALSPVLRILLLVVGTIFMAMTIALEWF